MTPDELVQLGAEIVNAATARGATVRLFGGVAIRARCPSLATHPALQREHHDLDLIAAPNAWGVLPDLFIARGFEMQENSPQHAVFGKEGIRAEVGTPAFQEYHALNFAPRLASSPTTLSLADLLLFKLQRVNFGAKDRQDAIALLLDHRVATGGGDDDIDRAYLYQVTNRDWGLWTTVFDNTVTLEKILDKYLAPEAARLVWRRIELIQEVLDGKGKSLGWWSRRLVGKRVKWYREPSRGR